MRMLAKRHIERKATFAKTGDVREGAPYRTPLGVSAQDVRQGVTAANAM